MREKQAKSHEEVAALTEGPKPAHPIIGASHAVGTFCLRQDRHEFSEESSKIVLARQFFLPISFQQLPPEVARKVLVNFETRCFAYAKLYRRNYYILVSYDPVRGAETGQVRDLAAHQGAS